MTPIELFPPSAYVPEIDPASFPPEFPWGVATSAYQIEGGVDADGRGRSIWDTFSELPGRTANGDTGAIAADHFHRWPDDVDLMSRLGVTAYRFSVAWPRIQPDGRGPANRAGLDFYSRLIDRLLDRGITPWVTLYHWDLPEALESAGGWPSRETAYRFADYAGVVAEAFADRVKHLITLNEPWCSAFLGYGNGIHAPGRANARDAVMASHHLMLGHGLAVPAIRSAVPDARLGITLNLYPVHPLADAAGMHVPAGYDDAVRRIDGLANRWFLDPVLRGRYPEDVLADLADVAPGDFIEPGDEAVIAAPLDFLGVNYYTRHMVAPSAFPGSNRVDFGTGGAPRTAMGWEVYPGGLVELLDRLHREYPPIPIVVTENGAAFPDDPDPDGRIRDHDRVSYLAHHVGAAATARQRGIPLDGYFAWSLMDNFEWGEGNDKRFGLVYIDYTTQERTIKDSGHWYASWIRRHREETESTVD